MTKRGKINWKVVFQYDIWNYTVLYIFLRIKETRHAWLVLTLISFIRSDLISIYTFVISYYRITLQQYYTKVINNIAKMQVGLI